MALFFFQAEDGIRDVAVTGVQTCALPISAAERRSIPNSSSPEFRHSVTPSDKAINMSPGFSRTFPERNSALGSAPSIRSEEHTSELQSRLHLVCRLLLEKKK